MSAVEADLEAALGGDCSPQQLMLIRSVAVKYTRLLLLEAKLFDENGEGVREDGHHCLAWQNAMRLDLQALGLARVPRVLTNTADVLVDHFSRPPQTIDGEALAA